MQRFFVLSIMVVLLSACVGSGRNTGSFPTSMLILTASPAISQRAASTIAPTEMPTLSPPPTSVPSSLIFADFPLSVGATWKYSAEISYQDPNNYNELVTWSGFITDKIVDEKTTADGKDSFTLQESLEPTPPQDVWRQARTEEYIISGDGIFAGSAKIYQWPLSDNLSWKWVSGLTYDVIVNYVGNVDVPYGKLKGCYTFVIATNPDTSIDTFCPGIGFVDHSYRHHGTPQIEHFVLVSYESGQ